MIALAILLAASLVGAVSFAAVLGFRVLDASERDADRRVGVTSLEHEIEMLQYENATLTAELKRERGRANEFEKLLQSEMAKAYPTSASDSDLASRIKLLAERFRSGATRPDHDPGDAEALPVDSPAE